MTNLTSGSAAPKAALWDMDGVIVDSAMMHFRAWQRLSKELDRTLSYDRFLETFGRKNADILGDLFGPGLSPEQMRELSDRKERYYREGVKPDLHALDGVRTLLESLRRAGYRQAVASSAPRENIELILATFGFASLFNAIVGAEDINRGKPDPQVFLTAAARLGVNPTRAIVFEDAVAGVQAAKRAGMAVIAVTNTRTKDELAEADLAVDSLKHVDVTKIDALLDDHFKKAQRSGGNQ